MCVIIMVVFSVFSVAVQAVESLKNQFRDKKIFNKLENNHYMNFWTDIEICRKFLDETDYIKAGYVKDKDFIDDRRHLAGLLMKYSTERVDIIGEPNTSANNARQLLMDFNVDPKAETGIWDFKAKISALNKDAQKDFKELEDIEKRMESGKTTIVDCNRAKVIKESIKLRKDMAEDYANMEIITRWNPESKPFSNKERYEKSVEALNEMALLAKDLRKGDPISNIIDTIQHAKNHYTKTKIALDSLIDEFDNAVVREFAHQGLREEEIVDPNTNEKIKIMADEPFRQRWYGVDGKDGTFDVKGKFDQTAQSAQSKLDAIYKQIWEAARNDILPGYVFKPPNVFSAEEKNTVIKDAMQRGHRNMRNGNYEEALAYYVTAKEFNNALPKTTKFIKWIEKCADLEDYIDKAKKAMNNRKLLSLPKEAEEKPELKEQDEDKKTIEVLPNISKDASDFAENMNAIGINLAEQKPKKNPSLFRRRITNGRFSGRRVASDRKDISSFAYQQQRSEERAQAQIKYLQEKEVIKQTANKISDYARVAGYENSGWYKAFSDWLKEAEAMMEIAYNTNLDNHETQMKKFNSRVDSYNYKTNRMLDVLSKEAPQYSVTIENARKNSKLQKWSSH